MRERCVEEVWIEETIKTPSFIRKVGKKYEAIKKLNGVTLKVVYTRQNYITVITPFG